MAQMSQASDFSVLGEPISVSFAAMRFSFLSLAVFALLPFSVGAEVNSREDWMGCSHHLIYEALQASDGAADSSNTRQYARDREIDVKHLRLELDPDFAGRSLAGKATLSFSPIAQPLVRLRLDAVRLQVLKVESTVPLKDWVIDDDSLRIVFVDPIKAGTEASVTVTYTTRPKKGWYFRTEEMGYPAGDDHFWTQGEPDYHRNWFPGYDYPNERFTSEVICRVPKGMIVLSNGRLVEEKSVQGPSGPLSQFHWTQEQEHPNYLISVVGGYFKKLEAKHGDLPLSFYTPPSEFGEAGNSFDEGVEILAFLEKEIGVKYPWVKYDNVCVTDFLVGGMENTSITTLNTSTLFSKETENLRSSRDLWTHEAVHQWFGDLITCKDWSHVWLNEGFATYYTHLYNAQKFSVDQMRYRLLLDSRKILQETDEIPIVWRGYSEPWEMFGYRIYPKGAWVLHMLRSQVGADLFQKCVQTYLERYRNRSVETNDLMAVFAEMTGRSWDRFFDQWVFHGGVPRLKITYAWDKARHQVKLSVRQIQKVSEAVLFFDFPLPVRFVDEKGAKHEFTIRVRSATEDFYFDLPTQPKIARIDPEVTVLAEIDFTPPTPLLLAQLSAADDAIGRVQAATLLSGREDRESMNRLGEVIRSDAFYGVRISVAEALAKTHTTEALDQLIGALDQPDARVRQAVLTAIGSFYRTEAFDALLEHAKKEKNPDILGNVLVSLAKFPRKEVMPLLLTGLERKSYRNRVATSAIQGLKVAGDAVAVKPLVDYLRGHASQIPTADFGKSLEALGTLAHSVENDQREDARLFLLSWLENPKQGIRVAAMNALGSLGDIRSVAVLQTFLNAEGVDSVEGKAAKEAIRSLQSSQPQAAELIDLRRAVTELQTELRKLREAQETHLRETHPATPTSEATMKKTPQTRKEN